MKHNQTFKRVALMGRQRLESIEETLLSLYKYLKTKGYSVAFEQETAKFLPSDSFTTIASEHLSEACEILIVVGGDGSLLHGARVAVAESLPVIGINLGRLGFLTDIYPHEFDKIDQILNGQYREEHRFLLLAEIYHQNHLTGRIDALNEIVLSPGKVAHMIEFEIMIHEQFVYGQRADGVIVATPTGSTAYALSGGGPILHPSLNAIVLVPMFPHTLSNRPIVLDGESRIAIKISEDNQTTPYVSGDGHNRIPIELGDIVRIQKKDKPLRLIHPIDYDYFQTLRAKLGWQSKHPSSHPHIV